MAKKKKSELGLRKIWGILLLVLFLFSLIGLLTYDWQDISIFKRPPNNPPSNMIGLVGAWLSFALFALLGVGAYLTPVWCLAVGGILIWDEEEKVWPRVLWASLMMLMLAAAVELNPDMWASVSEKLNIRPGAGGFFGYVLMDLFLVKYLSVVGAGMFVWAAFFVALLMLVGSSNLMDGVKNVGEWFQRFSESMSEKMGERDDRRKVIERQEKDLEKRRKQLEKDLRKQEKMAAKKERSKPAPEPEPAAKAAPEPKPEKAEKPKKKPKKTRPAPEPEPEKEGEDVMWTPLDSNYELPPLDLLQPSDTGDVQVDSETTSKIMIETLAEFGIDVEVTNVEKGPVVTRYELLPAAGVRVERIAGLANNLALSLKAHSVRVQAPVPGKGVVGVEVPNSSTKMVVLRDLLESKDWKSGKCAVPLALGVDVGGKTLVADMAKMPHLLVAGATGAGKTVCMNSLLAGLLMSRSPDQLRLLLVDPKIVEFTAFNDLPHLVAPVITDPKKVGLGLRWAINEMEKRYKLFAKVGVRNIESYNSREIATQEDMFGEGGETKKKDDVPARVPYILIVVDELADLMLVDQAGIENSIARLAQLSRAVGIHMILSTQRPSVNVITGTIKANFPARVAFQVAQRTDSRTILDVNGAEMLLGRGDMLFLPPGASKVMRAQGAWTSDEEIRKIVDHIKKQAGPSFDMEIKEKLDKSVASNKLDSGDDDELLSQAIDIIRETQRASTSSLQRRLRIGYTRAARMIDILEERGIIGPPRGSDPREILIDLDGEIPHNADEPDETPEPEEPEEVSVDQDAGVEEDDEIIVEDAESEDRE